MYTGPNYQLGDTYNMLRESVYQFARAEIAPLAAQLDETNTFPHHLWKKLGDMGLLGITVSEEYGGANARILTVLDLATIHSENRATRA